MKIFMTPSSTQLTPKEKQNAILILLLLGGIIIVSSTMFGMLEILRAQGFASVFEAINLRSELKVSIALYATLAGLVFTSSLLGVHLIRVGFSRGGGVSEFVAS